MYLQFFSSHDVYFLLNYFTYLIYTMILFLLSYNDNISKRYHICVLHELDKLNEARNCLEYGWRLLFNPLRDAMYGICDILQDVEGMCSTANYTTLQCSAVHYCVLQYSTVPYSVQCDACLFNSFKQQSSNN